MARAGRFEFINNFAEKSLINDKNLIGLPHYEIGRTIPCLSLHQSTARTVFAPSGTSQRGFPRMDHRERSKETGRLPFPYRDHYWLQPPDLGVN